MLGQQLISQVGDGVNLYAPPVTQEDPWTIGDPAAAAIRREHQKEEAYLKAMGILNYFYAFFFADLFAVNLRYPVLYALHRVDAPWSVQPLWIIGYALTFLLTILAFVAGYGFRRLKRWALHIEVILVLCWLMFWFVTAFLQQWTTPIKIADVFVYLLLYLALATPMMDLLDVRHSPVLERKYRTIIEATSHIRVRAKMPLANKLLSGLLLVCSLAARYLSYKGW